jgi:hypothetical protein
MTNEVKAQSAGEDGICIWCGTLNGPSPFFCSPECQEVWAKLRDDPVVAAEQETLFKLAPIYTKLDPNTKRQFNQSCFLVAKVAKARFGLVQTIHPDLSPLCDKSRMKLVDLVADYEARPYLEADWQYGFQAPYTENPETRLAHALLEMREQLGRYYNALVNPVAAREQQEQWGERMHKEHREKSERNRDEKLPGWRDDPEAVAEFASIWDHDKVAVDAEEIKRERQQNMDKWWSRTEILDRIVKGLGDLNKSLAWALEDAKEAQTVDLINGVTPPSAKRAA